jgi:recombination protein RecT
MTEEKKQTALVTVASYLNKDNVKTYLESVLKERTGQFITSLVSMSNLTPGLAKCDPNTLMQCGLKAASLNLPLDNNLGFAYAIPYGNKASFQMGYKGFIQLAQRTGQYKTINVVAVKEGELKKWEAFTEELEVVMVTDPIERGKLSVIGYAAILKLTNGFEKKIYWCKAEVLAHAKRFSKTFGNGPWQTDFDKMGMKTVLKDLISKYGPMSVELQEAIKYDQAIIKEDADGNQYPEYPDNPSSKEPTQDSPYNDDTVVEGNYEVHENATKGTGQPTEEEIEKTLLDGTEDKK